MGKVKRSGPRTRSSATVDKFTASYKISKHNVFQNYPVSKILFKTSSHDYCKRELKWLIDNGYFNRGSCICDGCLFTLENKWEVIITIQTIMTKNESVGNGANYNVSETISATVNFIEQNKIGNAEKNVLLAALEKSISSDIYNESVDMANALFQS